MADAPPVPSPQGQAFLQPVLFEARDRKTTYFVGVEAGAACQTPCSLPLPAGPQTLIVNGPGSKLFRRQVVIPDVPVMVKLQHVTTGRIIAGSILSAVSLPLNFFGALLAFAENDPRSLPFGVLMLITGVACTIAGITLLATLRTNAALVQPLPRQPTAGVRLEGVGLGLTSDRRGGVVALILSY